MRMLNLAQVLSYYNKDHTIVLFTDRNTFLFSSKSNNKDYMMQLLSSGEVISGRVLLWSMQHII